jgi:hypothetical protein
MSQLPLFLSFSLSQNAVTLCNRWLTFLWRRGYCFRGWSVAVYPFGNPFAMAGYSTHIEKVHETQNKRGDPNIPSQKPHQFYRRLRFASSAKSQRDKAEIDEIETHHQKVIDACRQFSVVAKAAD